MDTGPMLLRAETPIGPEETAGELSERLATLGAEVILNTLARLDTLKPTPQPDGATLAPRLKKTDGAIDWQRPARQVVDLVRGCNPWPGASIALDGGALSLWRARVVSGSGTPGTLVPHGRSLAIAAGEDAVLPVEVQPESRRAMAWDEFLRGARLAAGQTLTSR